MKILAVDDDEFILELLPVVAQEAGFPDITTVASPNDALRLALTDAFSFDCFILDIRMPEIDGVELCRRIREIRRYRSAPILMLTSVRDAGFVEQAFKAGATDYITKPFDVFELAATLSSVQASLTGAQETDDTLPFEDLSTRMSDEAFQTYKDQLMHRAAFANYLSKMPDEKLEHTKVAAVKVCGLDGAGADDTPDDFVARVIAVAGILKEMVRPEDNGISYFGRGLFLVLGEFEDQRLSTINARELEFLITQRLWGIGDCNLKEIAVSIGRPVKPIANRRKRSKFTIDRAIGVAEERMSRKTG